ncbi:DUF2237 family protein [Thiocapsa marina]|uniref:Uncharacterized protein n=1 Tax=Thiocapsa marina 5811 TaxID=768671 RepID=F9U9R2_9GAMM|nr:hypothetical protein [Thiocapsa marina]EGV18860.1 hypothetical protein ThimaDRAFT_1664 [Thiocapsa marina 5811]
MPEPINVLGEPVQTCSPESPVGFARCGTAETALQAIGSHTRCDRADLS